MNRNKCQDHLSQLPQVATLLQKGCGKTRNARTQNSGIRNNKSGTVKRGTTSLVRLNADYLHLNFNISQCKSNSILIFTPVEGFSNRYWYGQGNYLSHNTLFKFVYILFIHNLNCHQLHIYYLYFEMLYISYIINIFDALYIIWMNYMFLFPSCKNLSFSN